MTFTLDYIVKSAARVHANGAKRRKIVETKAAFKSAVLASLDMDAKSANGVFYAETRQELREAWLALTPAGRKKIIAEVLG